MDSFHPPSAATIRAVRLGAVEFALALALALALAQGKESLGKRKVRTALIHRWSTRAMAQTAVSRILIGPYGLHAFMAVVLVLFLGFLWVFNFTAFF
jgi:hypothetical protein